jgi:hypothetical protein
MSGTCRTRHKSGKNRKHRRQSRHGAIGESAELERKLDKLAALLLAHVEFDNEYRADLNELLLGVLTNMETITQLPEFFPPTYRGIH